MIVVIFFISNLPRTVLNLLELNHVSKFYFVRDPPGGAASNVSCYDPPLWAMMMKYFSNFLLTLNASIGFFVYCLTSEEFRSDTKKLFSSR